MDDLNQAPADLEARLMEEARENVAELLPNEEPQEEPRSEEPATEPDADKGETLEGKEPKEEPSNADDFKLDEKTVADIRDNKLIPKHRMDEILEQLNAYKSFGSPEDLRRKMAGAIKETSAKPGKTDELTDEDKRVEAYLMKFPKFREMFEKADKFGSFVEQRETQEKAAWEGYMKKVEGNVAEFATKELGISSKNSTQMTLIQNTIADIIHASPELSKRFYTEKDLSVLDEAKKQYNDLFSGVRRATKAEIFKDKKQTSQLPKPTGKGGIPPAGNAPKPQGGKIDFDAIGDAAFEHMTASNHPEV